MKSVFCSSFFFFLFWLIYIFIQVDWWSAVIANLLNINLNMYYVITDGPRQTYSSYYHYWRYFNFENVKIMRCKRFAFAFMYGFSEKIFEPLLIVVFVRQQTHVWPSKTVMIYKKKAPISKRPIGKVICRRSQTLYLTLYNAFFLIISFLV